MITNRESRICYKTVSSIMLIILLFSSLSSAIPHESDYSTWLFDSDNNTTDMELIISEPEPSQGSEPTVQWNSFSSPPAQSMDYYSIEVADLNLDGNLDIVGGYDNTGIHVWTGDGAGSWASMTSPTNIGTYYDIAVEDINNDGKPDIVGAAMNGVDAWTGDGTGSWATASTGLPINGIYNCVDIADVNLDGNMDIIIGTQGQFMIKKGIQVLLGDGNGAWIHGDANLPNSGTYYGLATGDFNNDGKPDIAAANNAGIEAWAGDGTGTWTLRESGLSGSGTYSDVEFGDFNNDGLMDIAGAGNSNNGLTVWNGDGWGTWTMTFDLPFTGNYNGISIGDVNIDGYLDIMTASTDTSQMIWTGDGLDNWYPQNTGLDPAQNYFGISAGDMNNDGRLDFCGINSIDQLEINIALVERAVNFWNPIQAPPTSGSINDITVHDINLDGKMDISYGFDTKGIEIWTGDGTENWTSFNSPITSGNVNSLSISDFNNDGNLDIIATSDLEILAWVGDGTGTWDSRSSGLSLGIWQGLTIADFNDDGNPDIAAGTGSNSGLAVYNGDGWGIWTMTFNLPFSGTYYDLEAGDINNDGAIDLIAADGGLRVWLGDANDGWTESSVGLPDNSNQYYSVELADLNDDGYLDIIGASESAGINTWLGDGTGSWVFDSNVITDASIGLDTGDFSIDGLIDIVSGSSLDSGLRGTRQGSWTDVSDGLFQTGDFTTMELTDINIDGRLDIITANYTSGTPNIWIGEYALPPSSYSIGPLQVGWNMISLPLVPENSTMPDVLIDLDGNTTWSSMKLFEPLDPTDPWKSYDMDKPASLQEISDISNTQGIWVFIPDIGSLGDGFIRVEGEEPTSTVISLYDGWNLVGYPSMTSKLASATLPATADMVSIFDAGQPYLIRDEVDLNAVTMNDGEAYWIHVTSDCVWDVDY